MTADHRPTYGRTILGRRRWGGPSGSYYGATVRCSCGWKAQVNQAPSKGGTKQAEQWFAEHVKENQ